MTLTLAIVVIPIGFVAWTLTEYLAHRFLMHSTGGRGPAAHEHLMHHAQPARTRTFVRTIGHLSMYATAAALGWLLTFAVATPIAVGLAVGWAFGYTAYEGLHFAAHHHKVRGRYDRWLRERHFHHHFGSPKKNLGVLVPWWDRLFGTEERPMIITVPRRVAMAWLLDDDGQVRREFAARYRVVGRRARTDAQLESDRTAAFADRLLSVE